MSHLFGSSLRELRSAHTTVDIDDDEIDAICLRALDESEEDSGPRSPNAVVMLEPDLVDSQDPPPTIAVPFSQAETQDDGEDTDGRISIERVYTHDQTDLPYGLSECFNQLDDVFVAFARRFPDAVVALERMGRDSPRTIPPAGRGPATSSALLRVLDRRIVRAREYQSGLSRCIRVVDNVKYLLMDYHKSLVALAPDHQLVQFAFTHPSLSDDLASDLSS